MNETVSWQPDVGVKAEDKFIVEIIGIANLFSNGLFLYWKFLYLKYLYSPGSNCFHIEITTINRKNNRFQTNCLRGCSNST